MEERAVMSEDSLLVLFQPAFRDEAREQDLSLRFRQVQLQMADFSQGNEM
jgi:hypothetical protein